MKGKVIAVTAIAVFLVSIYVFLSVEYKELQNEPFFIIVAYYLGMGVCFPAMLITPFIPDSLNAQESNAVVGSVGVLVSVVIGYGLFRQFSNKK